MEIDTEAILNRFKNKKGEVNIFRPQTLFEPTFKDIQNALKEKRCPICSLRIYEMRNGGYHCRSKKHKGFFITKNKFNEIVK